jgi:mono/diheme cytochrome c family protein
MCRLVAFLLLSVFLLQSSWAVAAAYCQHETRRDMAHFGHHVDLDTAAQASAAAADDDHDATSAESAGHGHAKKHCHDCHGSGIGLVFPALQLALLPVHQAPELTGAPRLPAPPIQPLERPDWQHLA